MNVGDVFETTGQDWANHLSHEMSGNGAICFIALLAGKPDVDILRQATTDLIAAQPVLGCGFDETSDPPVWIPAEVEGRFAQTEVADLRDGLDTFLQETTTRSRMMEVRLISCSGQFALCLRLDHSATDGGGAKGCLSLLNQLYNVRLAGEKPSVCIPLDRSEGQIFARCGLQDFRAALRKGACVPDRLMTVPYDGMDGRRVQYEWLSLPLSAARRPGCTVNDRLLAASSRALTDDHGDGRTTSIQFTVDLRRYLDAESAPVACNLSGIESVSVYVSPQETFDRTLTNIRVQTGLVKADRPGLASAAAMAFLRTMNYRKAREFLLDSEKKRRLLGTAIPILSNLGQLCQGTMWFGSIPVVNILQLLPAFHAPAFMLAASGYENSLTLSAGFYAGERKADDVRRYLRKIRDELLSSVDE